MMTQDRSSNSRMGAREYCIMNSFMTSNLLYQILLA